MRNTIGPPQTSITWRCCSRPRTGWTRPSHLCGALEIDQKWFGDDHPRVATDLDNLASLLKATNRLKEAEPLMRRALAINEKSFDPEHPEVAIRLNNLAQLLLDTNRMDEAEPLMRRALEIDQKSFGPEHPKVAIRLNNLAQLFYNTNRIDEAEPLIRRRWRSTRSRSVRNTQRSPFASITWRSC